MLTVTDYLQMLRRVLRRLLWTRHFILPAILIAFLIQGFRIVPGYRGQMNPDGVSYLTIAKQYLHGHFADAVNAYWSPLYSWLLVPLLGMGVESLLATKVLAILIGTGILACVWWLLRNLAVAVESRVIACFTLFPILYYFGMGVTTPDLLVTAMLLLYAAQMTSPRWGRRWWDGALSGVLGGLAYLAKAYALPVVGLHLVLVGGGSLVTRRNRKRRRLGQIGLSVLMFSVVVGAWSAILAHKYGSFTTGSTGAFNIAFNRPKFQMPTHIGVLLPPPNDTGTSGWDDATVLDYVHWKPWATAADRAAWAKNRARNEKEFIALLRKFTWLFWPILIAGARLAGSRFDPKPRRPGAIFATLLVIYPIGYWLLHVDERFLSLLCIGLLVMGVFAVARLTWPLNRWVRLPMRVVLMAAVAWSFLSKPNWRYGQDLWPHWSIAKRWGSYGEHTRWAELLAGLMPARAKLASVGDWDGPLYTAYLLDLRYYGQAMGRDAKIQEELTKHGIEYLWVCGRAPVGLVKDKPELTAGRVPQVRIYDLRPKPTTQP